MAFAIKMNNKTEYLKEITMSNDIKYFAKSVILLSLMVMPLLTYAGQWSVHAGAGVQQSPYKEYKTEAIGFILPGFQGERFFIEGTEAGVYILNSEHNQVYTKVALQGNSFDPSDSKDKQLKKLDKRKAGAIAGLGYKHHAGWGSIHADIMAGKSNRILAEVGYQYPFQFKSDKFNVTPGISVQWQNKKLNDYYYGVSEKEALRSRLKAYKAKSGVSASFSVTTGYAFNENWSVFAIGSVTKESKAVKNSPMTERGYSSSFLTGVSYHF